MLKAIYFALHFAMVFLGMIIAGQGSTGLQNVVACVLSSNRFYLYQNPFYPLLTSIFNPGDKQFQTGKLFLRDGIGQLSINYGYLFLKIPLK